MNLHHKACGTERLVRVVVYRIDGWNIAQMSLYILSRTGCGWFHVIVMESQVDNECEVELREH